jgi:hypothetical protein
MRWSRGLSLLLVAFFAVASLAVGAAAGEGRVYPNPEAVEPLGPGAQVPAVGVAALDGDPVDLAEVLRSRGALLVFFRGGW